MKQKPKLYVIRKYIYAMSAHEAIKKDKTHPVEDVWVDDEWKKSNLNTPQSDKSLGFKA